MKVLLINKFHYLRGGSETYYFGLGELLKKNGHEVIYFSMKDERNVPCEQEKYFVENVDFNKPMSKLQMIRTGLKMLYSFEAKRKMEQLIRDERPDIAHLNIFQSQLTGSIVDVLYKYHIPMVYTMHDLKALCPCYTMLTHGRICEECKNGSYVNCIKHRCMKDSLSKSVLAALEARVYRIRRTYQKIDLIITPSAFYKRKLEEAGITDKPIIHMCNFLPERTDSPEDVVVGNYYLYFGRLSIEKGLFTLLEAYRDAHVKRPLYIVGTGPIEDELKKRIAEYGLGDSVRMLGYKTGQELKELVRNSYFVVLPSEWYENGPYSIMEAQVMGKPCIVSSLGGLSEIVLHEMNGYVTEAIDVRNLCKCMQQMDIITINNYKEMCRSAFDSACTHFDKNAYAEKLIQEYSGLIGRG